MQFKNAILKNMKNIFIIEILQQKTILTNISKATNSFQSTLNW